MKPPVFAYVRAENEQHAVELLSQYGDEGKIISGGQSLVPMLNFRLARPKVLVDISRIAEKNKIEVTGGRLSVSGVTLQREMELSPLVQERIPVLYEAVRHIGHIQIRNKGTIGGSISHGDPAAELPAVSLVLDAEYELASVAGRRTVPAEEFFITYMMTDIGVDEMLSKISFKLPGDTHGWGFQEMTRRSGDFALAGSIALIEADESGRCARARISLFGVAPTPIRVKEAERLLEGEVYSATLADEAAELAKRSTDPEDDVHVTASYRREMAGVLTRRALEQAFQRMR